jgi:hypothetical protein
MLSELAGSILLRSGILKRRYPTPPYFLVNTAAVGLTDFDMCNPFQIKDLKMRICAFCATIAENKAFTGPCVRAICA